jgi:hypothetical protein
MDGERKFLKNILLMKMQPTFKIKQKTNFPQFLKKALNDLWSNLKNF